MWIVKPIREKKHRLPGTAYHGVRTVSFTACIQGRRRPFVHRQIVEPFTDVLSGWILAKGCISPIYCFMPDHLHVIIVGQTPASRAKEAMEEFKESTSRWFLENRPQFHWQKDFHDHIIRVSDDWRNHVSYILRNPVRAGLVDDPWKYPFTGSFGIDIYEVLSDL